MMEEYIIKINHTLEHLLTAREAVIIFFVIGALILLSLQVHLSPNPKRYKILPVIILIIYLAGNLYITIFSRQLNSVFDVRIDLLSSYGESLKFDSGLSAMLQDIYHNGLSAGLSDVHIQSQAALEQIILNILLYMPLGYLIPLVIRPLGRNGNLGFVILIGFFCSLCTEIMQYYMHLGYFDVDDILNNTIGTIIGAILYLIFLKRWRDSRRRKKRR